MGKFIVFLYRLVNLYLYFVLGACILSWIPNINPNYPLFHYIFKFAGFYLIPPVMGMFISPALVLILTSLVMIGLSKIYHKFYERRPFYLASDRFLKSLQNMDEIYRQQENANQESEDFDNDCNKDN